LVAPVQVRILPIGPGQHDYVRGALSACRAGIRAEADLREEKIAIGSARRSSRRFPTWRSRGSRSRRRIFDIRSKRKGRVGAKTVDEFLAIWLTKSGRRRIFRSQHGLASRGAWRALSPYGLYCIGRFHLNPTTSAGETTTAVFITEPGGGGIKENEREKRVRVNEQIRMPRSG